MVDRRCHQIQGIGRLFLNGGMMCMTLETNMLGWPEFYFHMDIHGPSSRFVRSHIDGTDVKYYYSEVTAVQNRGVSR